MIVSKEQTETKGQLEINKEQEYRVQKKKFSGS